MGVDGGSPYDRNDISRDKPDKRGGKVMDNTIITVESTKLDGYGNLMVTPKGGGKDIRIGAKRPQLFAFFSEGAAVELIWDNFKDKDYVSDAKLVEGSLPAPKQPMAIEAMKTPPETKPEPPAPQAVGMMTKELGDMIRAKMLTTLFGVTIKKELVKWYRSQVFGITRINYDGKDLPEDK